MPPIHGVYRPSTPVIQDLENKKEAAQVSKYAPLLQERIDHLKERIDYYGNVDAIPVDVDKDAELHLRYVAINKGMKAELLDELTHFEELIKQHSK